jgi:hypothetical protein
MHQKVCIFQVIKHGIFGRCNAVLKPRPVERKLAADENRSDAVNEF